jgi:hypothetical protein
LPNSLYRWWQAGFYKKALYRYYRLARKGARVSIEQFEAFQFDESIVSPSQHNDAVSLDGLDHVFRWASDVVADRHDDRLTHTRENRIRRQVFDVVQKFRDQKLLLELKDENAYLQRRVIALLTKLQEVCEENANVKQIMVTQLYSLQRIPELELEIKKLKAIEYEKEAAVIERRYLMSALAKLKIDRDFLEELVVTNESENDRLARLIKEAHEELAELKGRRWWHMFLPRKKSA